MNTYNNPIIFADYSDPDIVRIEGEGYYLTASSFNYTPGLPILYSRDLVHWELTGYAVKELGREYDMPRHSEGIWAPSIRYYDDMFYIYYGMPDDGLYVVRGRFDDGKAESQDGYIYNHGIDLKAKGSKRIIWDKPVCVLKGKGLIDPCPYRDDDGRMYLIHAYAKSRIGFKSILGMIELDSEGLKPVSEDRFIFNGGITDGSMRENETIRYKGMAAETPDELTAPAVTIEGPKVYKRDGRYYILAPAGGVREGWQLALRADNIAGPYECKIVMHKGSSPVNGPHQGGLTEGTCGREYFVHFQDLGAYGRVCHMQPVSWKDGWPVIGEDIEGTGCGEPARSGEICDTENDTGVIYETRDDLQWLGNYSTEYFEVLDKAGNVLSKDIADVLKGRSIYMGNKGAAGLKLQALNSQGMLPVIWKASNVLTRKLDRRKLSAMLSMDIRHMQTGDRAGIVFMGGEYCFVECERISDGRWDVYYGISREDNGSKSEIRRKLCEAGNGTDRPDRFVIKACCNDTDGDTGLYVNVSRCHPVATFSYSISGMDEAEFKHIEESFAPSDHTWVGARLGVYTISKLSRGGYIVIDDYSWA